MEVENISHHTTGSSRQGIAAYARETVSASNVASVSEQGTSLYGLTPGKVFSGEIVALHKDKVMLKLDSGEIIQASTNSQVELRQGQLLAFLVKSNNKKQLAIKPLFDVVINNSSVLKALENAGVPVTAKNAQLINQLMMEQMPIDKDTVTGFLRKMTLYPDTKIDTLVDLKKMGLFLNQENIEKFQQFQNHGYRLTEDVSLVSGEIAEYLADTAKEDGSRLLGDFRTITDLFLPLKQQVDMVTDHGFLKTGEEPVNLAENGKTQVFTSTPVGLTPEVLTNVQQEQMEQIETTWSKYEGQGVQVEQLVDGLKILNDQARLLLDELQVHLEFSTENNTQVSSHGAQVSPTNSLSGESLVSTTASVDLLSKIYHAFEQYEAGQIQEARKQQENSPQPKIMIENSKLHIPEKTEFAKDSIGGVLNEQERGNLAQKVYRLTMDISQYFAIRSGNMKSEHLVSMLRDMIPEELSQADFSDFITTEKELENGKNPESILLKQTSPKSVFGAKELMNQVAIEARMESDKGGNFQVLESERQRETQNTFLYSTESENVNEKKSGYDRTVYEKTTSQNIGNKYAYDKILEKLPEFKQVVQGKEFQKILGKVFEDKMSILPEELSKEKVKEYFENLSKGLDKYVKLVEENVNTPNQVIKNTQSLKQNVEYINQLNQLYSYVQIPLKLSGQNVNSELYVMTNKKRRREANEAFTALLHLDMQKLGPMDIFITMEGKRAAVRFYLEDEETARFMGGKSRVFLDKLQKLGFQITAEFEKKPENTKVVEEFVRQGKEANLEGEYSFDIRM